MKPLTRHTLAAAVALPTMIAGIVLSDRADGFSWFQYGAYDVVWVNARSTRYLSPVTFPPGSAPDTMIQESMGLWNIVPASRFLYSFVRNAQEFPIDNYDGYSDTAAVPASSLDPGVLGVTYLVNNGPVWYDMDMVFSDLPSGVGYTFDPNPPCDVVTAPTPTNGFSFLLVAVHEMGHALGLGHDPQGTEAPGTPFLVATMNPRYPSGGPMGQENIIELHADDRNGARYLYPNTGPSDPYVDLAASGYTFGSIVGKAIPVFFTPTSISPGGTLTIRSVIENLGLGSFAYVRQGFYLSSDPLIESTDTLLADARWDLAYGDAVDFDADVDLPADLAAGSYYVGTIFDDLDEVDETYEDNNAASYCTPLTVVRLAPVVNDIFQSAAVCGQPYSGPTPSVTHPINMSPITWSIDNPQPGMTINSTTGVVSWPNPIPSPFMYQIFVRATNSAGTTTKSMLIGVGSAPPQVSTISPQSWSACAGSYTGPTPAVTDPGCMNPIINWSLDAGPFGMTINHATGVVSWPAPIARATPYSISIRATNAAGNGTRTWLLHVGSGGDLNGDLIVTPDDAAAFVDALLGLNPGGVAEADMNCDGLADGRDVAVFVQILLGG
ncbi:MAG: matrixin family metalloprotease [Phycisphaerae bacterium]|nr:matrixin family metalloprotease [Phycisphaerae bacterium]